MHERPGLRVGDDADVYWNADALQPTRGVLDELLQPRLQLHVGRLHWDDSDLWAALASQLHDAGMQLLGDSHPMQRHADCVHSNPERERLPEAAWLQLGIDVERLHGISHAVWRDRDARRVSVATGLFLAVSKTLG
jgi:hypothetical protein